MRIVSLLPSATEIVCTLGLEDDLVGVTHECDYPPMVLDLPRVTRTLVPVDVASGEIDRLVRERVRESRALYSLDFGVLEELRPDLIVTQALCDVCAVAEEEVEAAACTLPGRPRVLNLEPETLWEVVDCLTRVGAATGREDRAERAVARLAARIDAVAGRSETLDNRPKVAFLEWLDPPFSGGHWNPEIVRLAGGLDGLGRDGEPSRTLRWEEVFALEPEVVFISCCGFSVERTLEDLPLVRGLSGWSETPAARSGRIHVVDGSHYFSRPGPRLVDSLEILAHTCHPDVHPLPDGLTRPVQVE